MRPLSLSLALLLATAAFAQDKTTHADVVVADAKGKAVRGLTAADFEVVRQGRATPVASVTEVTEPGPRRILILFDNSSLTLAHRRQTVAALKSFVDTEVRANDHVAIAATNPSLRQVLDWSSDKAAIAAALDTASKEAGSR